MLKVNNKKSIWAVDIMTLYPNMFPGPLNKSISGEALKNMIWSLNTVQIRDFAKNKYKNVDDTPTGGGTGMILRPDVLSECIKNTRQENDNRPLIYLSPCGELLNQKIVKNLSNGQGLILLCGKFKGIDQRLLDYENIKEISVGDYILSGGEIASLILIDACVRLLPNVIGNKLSSANESFENGLLEYPHYTKPLKWKGMKAPEILRSGNHAKIINWRYNQSKKITKKRRLDLWNIYNSKNKK